MGSNAKPEVAAAATGKTEAELAARAKILEGVDFVETEEDAEAVESAVVKIQSTFRGKKFRSKLGANKNKEELGKEEPNKQGSEQEELSKKVADMEVNDNSKEAAAAAAGEEPTKQAANPAEEEAERAATKIQAGFKGYKTRKELEGKLGGQQGAPGADK